MLGFPSDINYIAIESLIEYSDSYYDNSISPCGDCIYGNKWYDYHCEIDIRPIKGDYIQITDVHRFIVDKVIIHMPGCDDSFDITVECLLDADYYNGNA